MGSQMGTISSGTSVSHGQQSGLGVLLLKVLVSKLLAVDAFATL